MSGAIAVPREKTYPGRYQSLGLVGFVGVLWITKITVGEISENLHTGPRFRNINKNKAAYVVHESPLRWLLGCPVKGKQQLMGKEMNTRVVHQDVAGRDSKS